MRDLASLSRSGGTVDASFFARPVDEVAEDLVGRWLLVGDAECVRRALILESEAYGGPGDPASHAAFKPKGRAKVMWSEPGTIYVYAAYGMYPCLNIVTDVPETPSAVLIRGVWVEDEAQPTWGPGRTTRVLGISLDDHGADWEQSRFDLSTSRMALKISATPRVGISRGTDIEWRFVADVASIENGFSS